MAIMPRLTSKRFLLLFPLCAIFLLLELSLGPSSKSRLPNLLRPAQNKTALYTIGKPMNSPPSLQSELRVFWTSLSTALTDAKPSVPLPDKPIQATLKTFKNGGSLFDSRQDLIKLSTKDVDILRSDHANFVDQLPQLAPKLPFHQNTRGIVTTASGSFMPILVASLRMLRKTGSKMPVEVFVDSREVYEPTICEDVLAYLQARCIIMSEVLGNTSDVLEISGSQTKAFALLFSSFDEVLLLDADNIVVEKPETLMDEEPFKETGFVTWPDYWTNTASPKYYTISAQPAPPSSRAASSSSQLLISKSKHATTLLLTIYYNHHGPTHYYPLLTQNATASGRSSSSSSSDKETYLAAATALQNPIYTVQTTIETLGHDSPTDDGKFTACAAVQRNPSDDHQIHSLNNKSLTQPRRSFIYAHSPAMDAATVPAIFHREIQGRIWGSREGLLERFGQDVEMQLWADVLYTGCQLERSFRAWRNRTHVCRGIGEVYRFLFP